jgi:hypothetical protein
MLYIYLVFGFGALCLMKYPTNEERFLVDGYVAFKKKRA